MRTLQWYINKDKISNGDVRYFPDYLLVELSDAAALCTGGIREKLEWIRTGRINYPECPQCGRLLSSKQWDRRTSEYGTFCSKSCASKARQSSANYKERCRALYGADHPFSSKLVQDKRVKTNLERYGRTHPHPWASQEFSNIIESKHGVTAVRHITGVDAKIKSVIFEKSIMSFPEKICEIEQSCSVTCLTTDVKWTSPRYVDRILKWKHICGTIFESGIFVDLSGRTIKKCPKCSHGTSKLEQTIFEFVKQFAPDAVNRSKSVIPNVELDIFVPSLNLAIEVDGTYWHSAKFVDKNKAQRKLFLCKDKGIKLITVTESNYNSKKFLVESRIKSALNQNKKIFARQCSLVELNTELKNFFFNQNHLDGDARSNVCYALTHHDKVVAAMSFGKSRFSKKHEWEIIRAASEVGTTVVGGVSKLINYFIKQKTPESLITYADLDWGDGNSYAKAGMTFSHHTQSGYFYVSRSGEVISRYSAQKKKLAKMLGKGYDPYLTELQNMLNNGFIQVFNRGNAVYEWRELFKHRV